MEIAFFPTGYNGKVPFYGDFVVVVCSGYLYDWEGFN